MNKNNFLEMLHYCGLIGAAISFFLYLFFESDFLFIVLFIFLIIIFLTDYFGGRKDRNNHDSYGNSYDTGSFFDFSYGNDDYGHDCDCDFGCGDDCDCGCDD